MDTNKLSKHTSAQESNHKIFTFFRPDAKSVLGLENEQPPTKSNSLRRDSLGNIQHFLRTLAYWKRHRSAQPSTDSTQRFQMIKTRQNYVHLL